MSALSINQTHSYSSEFKKMGAEYADLTSPSLIQKDFSLQTRSKLAGLMQGIAEAKEQHTTKALNGRVNPHEIFLLGGDLFSVLYLGFEGAEMLWPTLMAIPGFEIISLICGLISGAVHIGTGFISLKEGVQALQNGDVKLAARLLFESAGLAGIGLIMVFASLAIRIAAFGALGVFFNAHPWIMPMVFFLLSIPVIAEISHHIYRTQTHQNWATQLADTDDIDALIQGEDPDAPLHLTPLLRQVQEKDQESLVREALSKKIEQLQADMGVETAIETFKLLSLHLKREPTEPQKEALKKKIQIWKKAQHFRALQQVLYVASFGLSMASLSSRANSRPVESTTTLGMAAAEALPVYINTAFPFARDVPIVIPKIISI